jgi:transcriptional regulator with XRE-family HTH domain
MTGEELKLARLSLGWSTYWCAEKIGRVSQSTWARWENGRDGKQITPPANVSAAMKRFLFSRDFVKGLD